MDCGKYQEQSFADRGNPGITQQGVSTARQDIQQILLVSTRFRNARQRVRKSASSSQTFAGYHVRKEKSDLCSWEIGSLLDYPRNRNSAEKYVHNQNMELTWNLFLLSLKQKNKQTNKQKKIHN